MTKEEKIIQDYEKAIKAQKDRMHPAYSNGWYDGASFLISLVNKYYGENTRFIVPLPGLKTTDGEQQYLTSKDGTFFACRRNEKLRQTWKRKHLEFIPEEYRAFAVEVE